MIDITAEAALYIITQAALVNLISTASTVKFLWIDFLFLHKRITPLEIICHKTILWRK
jgi:hypothetical protein